MFGILIFYCEKVEALRFSHDVIDILVPFPARNDNNYLKIIKILQPSVYLKYLGNHLTKSVKNQMKSQKYECGNAVATNIELGKLMLGRKRIERGLQRERFTLNMNSALT